MTKIDTNSWEFTQRIIRIGHNRRVRKYFKDINSDTATNTGRSVIKSALLIRDDDSALECLNKQIYFQNNLDNESRQPIIAYPEDYQFKAQSHRRQLIIIFKPTKRGLTDKHYPLSIPHYDGGRTPKFKSYYKGNYWARIILKDNSHIRVNGRTEKDAVTQLKAFLRTVDRKYRTELDQLKTGRYSGNPFIETKMIPYRADYYAQGKTKGYPDWQYYF